MLKKNKLLLLILFIAFLVRVVGIYPGHPPTHPDEPMSYGSAIEMLIHNDLNPQRFDYPAGVPLVHYLFFKFFILPPLFLKAFLTNPSTLIIAFLTQANLFETNPDILIGRNGIILLFASRFFTAFLGVLSVLLVYKISEKLFNKQVGIFSAVFLAFNYRHDLSSHLALSDIPNSFFVLLALYACIFLFKKNTFKRYVLAAICVGLSISMKYQVFALLPFLFVHLYWVYKKRKIKEIFNKGFLVGIIIIPLIFLFLNPYLFLNLKTAIPVIQYVGGRYGAGINKFNYYALFYLYKWGISMWPFIFIIIGFIFMLSRNSVKALLLLSYIGIFLYVFLYYVSGGGYVRNFTTVIPLLMIFAGFGFYQLVKILKTINKKIPFILIFALLILVNLNSIKSSIILAKDYTRPWSRDVMDVWVEKNIPENSTIRNGVLGVSSSVTKKLNLINWEHGKEDSIEEFVTAKDDFAVLNVAWHQAYMLWSDTNPKELLTYMDIPYRKLKDSYYGLSLTEFKDYAIWETYKSWQAPDDSYIVLKIPRLPKTLDNKIEEFHFDSDNQGWEFRNFSGTDVIEKINWNEHEGNETPGSLELTGNVTLSEFSRLISPFIKITPGKSYVVEAHVNNLTEIKENVRDGFFRIEIFDNNNSSLLDGKAIRTAVSGRTYGIPGWKNKKILIKSPQNGNYVTISFQRTLLHGQFPYYLDDVVIYEINDSEVYPKIPTIQTTIPDDLLYPIGIY